MLQSDWPECYNHDTKYIRGIAINSIAEDPVIASQLSACEVNTLSALGLFNKSLTIRFDLVKHMYAHYQAGFMNQNLIPQRYTCMYCITHTQKEGLAIKL